MRPDASTRTLVGLLAIVALVNSMAVLVNAEDAIIEGKKQIALAFMERIAGIDVRAYAVNFSYIPTADMPAKEWHSITYLNRGKENLKVFFDYKSGRLCSFRCEGKPLATKQEKSILAFAKETVELLESDFNVSNGGQFARILNKAVSGQNQTLYDRELALEIGHNGHSFLWFTFVNGVKVPFKTLSMEISEDGYLSSLRNGWDIYSIGSDEVAVPKEEAIDIALPYAQEYARNHARAIESINATLHYDLGGCFEGDRGDRYTLYPEWFVNIRYQDSEEDQWTVGYQVLVWADTGVVRSQSPLGVSGVKARPLNYLFLVFLSLFLASVIPLSFLVHRKKRSPKTKEV